MKGGFQGGMAGLMRQANRMQRQIEKRRESLREETVEAGVAGERVKVVINGAREVVSLHIAPDLLEEEGFEMMQDLLVAAVNAGLVKANEMIESELKKVTGGASIPGLF